MGALETLQRLLDDQHAAEIIGGVSIADALDCVDLSIAHSPVIPRPAPSDDPYVVPEPVEVTPTQGSGYILQSDPPESISADSLRVMRARYLLWRGHLYRQLEANALPHSVRSEVIRKMFDGAVYLLPKPNGNAA